jgi:hypothetical protein
VEYIAENLILPRCPTQSCRKWIMDFDACSALQCGRTAQNADDDVTGDGCGAHFCAWCLTICSDKSVCHRHVGQCPFNPADGCVNSLHKFFFFCVPTSCAERFSFHPARIPKLGILSCMRQPAHASNNTSPMYIASTPSHPAALLYQPHSSAGST